MATATRFLRLEWDGVYGCCMVLEGISFPSICVASRKKPPIQLFYAFETWHFLYFV